MKIIVHQPDSVEKRRQLQKSVAEIHARAITSYILPLSCPKEQKLSLIKAIQAHIKNKISDN